MIVKPDCPVKLTDFQARRILTSLQVGTYYQTLKAGAETLPAFSGFVSEFENVAKQFFAKTPYNFDNFVNDTHNGEVIAKLLDTLFEGTSEEGIDHLTALKEAHADGDEAFWDDHARMMEEAAEAARVEAERKLGFVDQEALLANSNRSDFDEETFSTPGQFYKAMFHNTNYLESKFKTKFIKEVVIRSLLIDTKSKSIVNTLGTSGENEVNKNLKDKRKEIFQRLIERNPIKKLERYYKDLSLSSTDTTSILQLATPVPTEELIDITPELAFGNPRFYDYAIQEIANRVTRTTYKGNPVNLLDAEVNSLYLIARDADNDNDPEAARVVDDYMDFVALHRFDEVLKQSFADYIYVSTDKKIDPFNDDLKYKFTVNKKEAAANSNWMEEIKGLETINNLYETIITSTPILDINTGLPTKDFLSKPAIQKAFSENYDLVNPLHAILSIKELMINSMHDNKKLWADRNILYTMYKNFFEEYGDDHKGNSYSSTNAVEANALANDEYPESYTQTLVYNNEERNHALMQLIAGPLRTIRGIQYAETTVVGDTVSVSNFGATGKTATSASVEAAVWNRLNIPEKVLSNFEKYQPTGGTSLDSEVEFTHNGIKYAIKGISLYNGNAKQDISMEAIHEITKDLLGIDFDKSMVDKDFKAELLSRERDNTGGNFPDYFIQFIRQSFKVLQAKHALLTNGEIKTAVSLKKPAVDLTTDNTLLNEFIDTGNRAIPADRQEGTIIKFNRMDTSQPLFEAYAASKDRVSGNHAKSVRNNKQGNAVALYSKSNLYTNLPRNLLYAKQLHNSIINTDPEANVYSHNALIVDSNLFKGFAYRDAIEVNGRVIPNSKQSIFTTYNININGSYFTKLFQSKRNGLIEVGIDPTVYSDKSKNAMAIFGNEFTFEGQTYKLFLDEQGKVVQENQAVDLQYRTSGPYYKKYGQNIVNDWLKIINYAELSNGVTFENRTQFSGSVVNQLRKMNEFNTGDFWNNIHPFLKGRDAALYYAGKTGVVLNNYVHYQATGKTFDDLSKISLTAKESLINEIELYEHTDSTKLKAWLDSKMLDDVNTLIKSNFRLTGDAAAFVESQYGASSSFEHVTFPNNRRNVAYNILKNGLTKASSIDDVLPAYRKFFYDWNFLSDNLLNVSLGNIHAHKGNNPNAAWTAMTKRNVEAGASIEPFIQGLERGIGEYSKVVYVDDVVTPIITVHGDKETIVDIDGGEYVTMTYRKKSYESLNHRYANDGGPEQKPFYSIKDFIKGQNGMTKLASFVLDKETIRNSIGSDIDFMKLHKEQFYNVPINHMDVTKSWKPGVDLTNLDLYVYRRGFDHETGLAGSIERIHSIKNIAGGNTYKVLKSNPINNGSYTDIVTLNTWFDLWQVLGDIDTVAPSKKKTSIYYTSDQGTKVYFEESDSSWDKLLDFEAYAGDINHRAIKANDIRSSGSTFTDGVYELYKSLTDEYELVEPKLLLMAQIAAGGVNSEAEYVSLGMHHVTPYADFVRQINENAEDVTDFINHVFNEWAKPEIEKLGKTWQPMKDRMIDRMATAGAQKYGQMNMNRASVYSKKEMQKYNAGISNDVAIDALKKAIESGEVIKECK